MKFPKLFRHRTLIFPTLLGWVAILALSVLIVEMLFRNMAAFLIVNESVGADYLVIEAWMGKEELDQGLEYFKTNNFSKVLLVGGPISNDFHAIDVNYAERAAAYLMTQGLQENTTAIVRAPYSAYDRTFLNAVMVREWFKQRDIPVTRLDVFSSGVHTRRSRDLYKQAFGEQVEIGIVASQPPNFDQDYWWKSSATGKLVAVEFANWVLTKCCFSPGPLDSHSGKFDIKNMKRIND